MRIRTKYGLLCVDPESIDKQVLNKRNDVITLFFKNGTKVPIPEPVLDWPLEVLEIPKIVIEVKTSKVASDTTVAVEILSAGPGVGVPRSSPQKNSDLVGEMIWTHKTAPEIVIFNRKTGELVKDVDISKMYRRR